MLRGVSLGALPVLTGCSVVGEGAPDLTRKVFEADHTPDPDVALAATALADERAALDALRATVARHRRLTSVLSPMIDSHRAHATLLARAAPPQQDPTPAEGRSPAVRSRFAVPRDPDAARKKIGALEADLSESQKRHAFAASSGAFARLLASMAASSAQQTAVLATQATSPGRS